MNDKLKTALIVLIIILIPVAGYIGYRYYTKKKSKDEPLDPTDSNVADEDSPGPGTSVSGLVSGNTNFPLKMNSSVKSNLVKLAQQGLNAKIKGIQPPSCPYYNSKAITSLEADGYYGPRTAAVVKYLYPDTDGKTITEEMYNELVTANSLYLFF